MKKFFIPPLVPLLMVVAVSIFIIWDETSNSPPRMINGSYDEAPRFAAVFMIVLTPLLYAVFAVINLIDACLDRLRSPFPWLASALMTAVLAAAMVKIFYVPEIDTSPATGIMMACVTALLTVWPMSLTRRLFSNRPSKPKSD